MMTKSVDALPVESVTVSWKVHGERRRARTHSNHAVLKLTPTLPVAHPRTPRRLWARDLTSAGSSLRFIILGGEHACTFAFELFGCYSQRRQPPVRMR